MNKLELDYNLFIEAVREIDGGCSACQIWFLKKLNLEKSLLIQIGNVLKTDDEFFDLEQLLDE